VEIAALVAEGSIWSGLVVSSTHTGTSLYIWPLQESVKHASNPKAEVRQNPSPPMLKISDGREKRQQFPLGGG